MFTRLMWLGIASAGMIVMGAGCLPAAPMAGDVPVAPVSAETVTQQLVFRAGDTFEVKQTFFGLGDLPSMLWKAKELARTVKIEAFEPKQTARLSWLAQTEQETQESAQARAAYEARIAQRKKGDEYPPPPAVRNETVTARGNVESIDLLDSQTLSLPTYWTPGIIDVAGGRSGIWLSQNSYRELERTSSTLVYFDVSSDAAAQLLKSSKEWVEAISRLRTQSARVADAQDPARLRLEGGLIDWPLVINGQRKTVNVWKAKNSFGELIILANQDNPLILKTTVNPVFPGLGRAAQGSTDLNALFGYEITDLTLPR